MPTSSRIFLFHSTKSFVVILGFAEIIRSILESKIIFIIIIIIIFAFLNRELNSKIFISVPLIITQIKALPNNLASPNVKYLLTRLKIWSLCWALLHTICFQYDILYVYLKLKAISIVILSNSALSDTSVVIDPAFRLYLKGFLFPRIVNGNFLGFAWSRLD